MLLNISASGVFMKHNTDHHEFMSKAPEKPEVFFLIGSLQVGGAEMHLSMITPQLVKRGYAVTVFNLSGRGQLGNDMLEQGVTVIGPPIKAQTGKWNFLNPGILIISSLKLFLIFLFTRPKIAHFFLPQCYVIGAIMACLTALPRRVMSRRSLNFYQNHHRFSAWLEQKLHSSMTAIIGNSKAVVTQLHQDEGVPIENLGLIYNGISLERFEAPFESKKLRDQMDIGADTLVMTILANLIPYKGHADLLEALADISSQLPNDWRLLVIGRDDGIGLSLKNQASESELDGNIAFLGPRDDIADLLRISNLGILCSHEEGFSNAILEGMAAGLPMIVTDVGGNAEAVINDKTGLVVPAHSPSELGAAILKLTRDAHSRKRMGRAARKRVGQEFSLEACVDQYEALYEAIRSDEKLNLEG